MECLHPGNPKLSVAIDIAIHPLESLVVDFRLRIAFDFVDGPPGPDDASGSFEAEAGLIHCRGWDVIPVAGEVLQLRQQSGNPRDLQLDRTARLGPWRGHARNGLLTIKLASTEISVSFELNKFGSHTQAPSMGMNRKIV